MAKLVGAALVLLLALGSVAPAGAQTYVSIGTGGTAGVYYQLGGAMAEVLNKTIPGTQANAEVTNGSVDNIKLVVGDPSYLGLASADVVADAAAGSGPFSEKQPVAALALLYPNQVQVVVRADSGIASIADMKGRHIATGGVGSGIEITAIRLLKASGLDPDKDVVREALNVGDSASALKDGKIDGFFFVGGAPASALTDLAVSPGIALKLIDLSGLLPQLVAEFGSVYSAGTIAAGTYPTIDADTAVINVWNVLVANQSMPEDEAYAIVQAIFANKDALAAVTASAKDLALDRQTSANSPIAFHPGAVRFLGENGIAP